MINTYYDTQLNTWMAMFFDEHGPIGEAVSGPTLEMACFRLGCEYERRPQAFAREMGKLLESYENSISMSRVRN